ncbi:DUF2938 domain-containing protein [Pelagerythrobacter marensis]|uniref:DUF2938 domain-containing protein n=1 Tax=Pelagerythrobacter marensis TaxID=543877 RepID=A0ABZ2D338_9SPHN
MAEILWMLTVGVVATIAMDLWSFLQKRFLGIGSLDYALVGRWLLHMPSGKFAHDNIFTAPACSREREVGWLAHYAIGVLFAALLLLVAGPVWARDPSLPAAIATGIATVAAPFFVLQPAFGMGIAASKTPRPMAARLRSLAVHGVFGLGLYAGALLAKDLL